MEHKFIKVNNIRMHYAITGDGPLMIFLHGFPEFWYTWKDQMAAFEDNYTCLAPDMRGYNLSAKPKNLDAYLLKTLTLDIVELCEAHSERGCILVGHDWGGVVAWSVAAHHPALVNKLVIINAPHPAILERELQNNRVQQRASRYIRLFQNESADTMLSAGNYALLSHFTLQWPDVTEQDFDAYETAWAYPGAITGGLNYYRAADFAPPLLGQSLTIKTGYTEPLNHPSWKVNIPTLVIWGMQDTTLREGCLEGLDTFVSDLTVQPIYEGTHWVHHEYPDQITALMREFLLE